MNFYQTFKEESIPIVLKLFQKKLKRREGPHTNFMRPALPDTQTRQRHNKKNYRPILLMNIDAEIFDKILAKQIQKYIKKILYHDQVGFIPGMKGWFKIHKSINIIHCGNKMKDKNYMTISTDAKKACDKIQHRL